MKCERRNMACALESSRCTVIHNLVNDLYTSQAVISLLLLTSRVDFLIFSLSLSLPPSHPHRLHTPFCWLELSVNVVFFSFSGDPGAVRNSVIQ